MFVSKPPMGWNSWNTFGKDINEKLIRETADAMVSSGLRDAGYNYLVIDDCWSEHERDSEGRLVASHELFPSGMKALSDYVHSKGLKFGMYSCAGVQTCAGFPASFNHEFIDAQTFADWGVDYLKYDYCYKPLTASGKNLYRRMSMALQATGREILFSACNWGKEDSWQWMRSAGADMYRSTGDINDSFVSFRDLAVRQFSHLDCSAPGCFNDIDMLIVGMNGKGNVGLSGCTENEYKMHFALWCLFGVPLMVGCDVRDMNAHTKSLLMNKELLRINQDAECRPPYSVNCTINVDGTFNPEGLSCMFKHLENGEYALGVFNLGDTTRTAFCILEDLGLPLDCGYALELTDVFTGEKAGVYNELFKCPLEPHDCVLYRCKMVKV